MAIRPVITLLILLVAIADAWAQGPRLEIEISGLPDEMLKAVQNGMGLYLQKDHPLLSDGVIRRLHRKASAEIQKALQPFGYYRAEVDAVLERTATGWAARYAIRPGEPIKLGEVEIAVRGAGANDPALERWRARYPLRRGDVPTHQAYEDSKKELLQLARERGYFAGQLELHRITIDLERYQAAIALHYDSGPRYTFGEIRFDQAGFAEEFLRRYLPFQSGDPYDAGKLLELQRVLADSDYFARAEAEARPEQAEGGRVPVLVTLAPRKRNRYTAGIGYSTDTGPRAMLGFENRHANRYGHRYGATLKESQVRSSATLRYQVPLARPVSDYLTYTLGWVDEDTAAVQRTTSVVAAEITQQAGPWQRAVGLSYELEHYKLGNSDDSRLLIPRIRWQRVKADQRIRTQRGWLINLEFRGASESVLSNTSFFQARADGKYIHGLTEHQRVLLRGSAGGSLTPALAELPASQRFLAGGDQSIRGYAYQSLGPVDAQGIVTGGRHLLVGSTEYEIDLGESTALAVFADAGNAFNNEKLEVKRGAGFGLRWRLPVGAIRLDFASALDKPGKPWRMHLTLGPDL